MKDSLIAELDNESLSAALYFRCLDVCVATPKYCRCLTVSSRILERSGGLCGVANNRLWKSDKKAPWNFVKSVQRALWRSADGGNIDHSLDVVCEDTPTLAPLFITLIVEFPPTHRIRIIGLAGQVFISSV